MISTVDDLLLQIVPKAEASLMAALGDGWSKLSIQTQEDAKAAAIDLAKLGLMHLGGVDVSKELLFNEAAIADVASKLADIESKQIKAAIYEIVGDLGGALFAFAKGAAKGLI